MGLALDEVVARALPGARIVSVVPLSPDSASGQAAATAKGIGYGEPLRIDVETADGARRTLVLHTERPNEYGHDRRSDRAASVLLAYDTHGQIPRHVPSIDVGAITPAEGLVSLHDAGEFYLLTGYADGHVYAEELRRIAQTGRVSDDDVTHCDALAGYLAQLHAEKHVRPAGYARAVRDLVGHGEGIFGIIDGYPPGVPSAPASRLKDIERRCVEWRWRLRARSGRLARTHGDFHPFNVVFDEHGALSVLDASRGCEGDPADDVTCMALNFVFFALGTPGSWKDGFGVLFRRFLRLYLDATGDVGVLDVAAPFLAWRALVLASPRWYPAFDPGARDKLLGFVERALDAERFDPSTAEDLFR